MFFVLYLLKISVTFFFFLKSVVQLLWVKMLQEMFFFCTEQMSIASLFYSDYCTQPKTTHYLDRQRVKNKIRLQQDETCPSRKWFSLIAHSQHSSVGSDVAVFLHFQGTWIDRKHAYPTSISNIKCAHFTACAVSYTYTSSPAFIFF